MSSRMLRNAAMWSALAAGSVLALDKVRVETRSDEAAAKFGLTGKGVIFAMIDRGIDWQNKDFQNSDGTTRIAYIFDLTDPTGAAAANNPYGKGTIYTQSQINQALHGGTPLAERDYLGHGTANTSIVSGSGWDVPKYHGIAPEATIIAVKLVNEATPAFGNTPAVPNFYDPSLIPVAIAFVTDKAKELNMPCVILMDIGTIGGPTDGTSAVTRTIDATVGNQPGLVFVAGAGDEGSAANHAAANVPLNGSVSLKFQKGLAGPLSLDFWYAGSDAFDVTIHTPDTVYGPFAAPKNDSYDFQTKLGELSYYHYGADVGNSWDSRNSKREIAVVLKPSSPNGEYSITLTGRTVANGHFDATLNPSHEWDESKVNFFENNIVSGSIVDFASAHNAVINGCSVIRTGWTDVKGVKRGLTNQGSPGQIWAGSSGGLTLDGRRAIDIISPAETIVTAYDPNSYWATFTFNEIQDGNGRYGFAGGNSSSNPVTVGIIVLMLEMNPKLDAFTVKDILHKSAKTDSFTGTAPNGAWGFGKIDALSALDLMHNTPRPAIGTVVNGASFAAGAVAPGQLFTIFGSNLGPASLTYHDDLSWDLRFIGAINGTEVLFDGVPAPMIYTSSGQIAGVVPYAIAGRTTANVEVLYEGVASEPVSVPVVQSSPAFFLAPVFSKTQAAVLNQDGTNNSPAHPESRGNTLVMFATGEGQTTPAGIDGQLAVSSTLPHPVLPVSVTIGGVPATLQYFGAAPGELAGVMQLNIQIPANAPTGTAVPVSLTIGNTASPANATLAIR